MKQCTKCKETKKLSEFVTDNKRPDKRFIWCKTCTSAQNRNRKYGVSAKTYQILVDLQQNKCAICKQPEKFKYGHLCVDHNHTTGTIRQLLCTKCNHGIGAFNDNIELLKAAIAYLEYHKDEIEITENQI